MELNFKHHLLAGTMLAGGALFGMCGVPTVAQAATCTTIFDNTGAGKTTSDCTDLITVAKNGSVATTNPSGKTSYDASDDALVGIINNSSTLISAIHRTGGTPGLGLGIFGFDGVGGCQTSRFTWVGAAACPVTASPNNYGDSAHGAFAGVTYHTINATFTAGDVFLSTPLGLAASQSGPWRGPPARSRRLRSTLRRFRSRRRSRCSVSASRVSASPAAAGPRKAFRTLLGRLLRSRPALFAVNAAGLRSGDPFPSCKEFRRLAAATLWHNRGSSGCGPAAIRTYE
jgi:hypothetical protein